MRRRPEGTVARRKRLRGPPHLSSLTDVNRLSPLLLALIALSLPPAGLAMPAGACSEATAGDSPVSHERHDAAATDRAALHTAHQGVESHPAMHAQHAPAADDTRHADCSCGDACSEACAAGFGGIVHGAGRERGTGFGGAAYRIPDSERFLAGPAPVVLIRPPIATD